MRNLILLLPLLIGGCAQPNIVTRNELGGLQSQRQEPKLSMWYYTGSRDGYHYFHHDDLGGAPKGVRIAEAELSWTNTFPLTHTRTKWRQLDWGQPH
jgi:hypothetical protein